MRDLNLHTNKETLMQRVGGEDGVYVICTSTALIQRKYDFFVFDGPMRQLKNINGDIVASFDVETGPNDQYRITNLMSGDAFSMGENTIVSTTLFEFIDILFHEELSDE